MATSGQCKGCAATVRIAPEAIHGILADVLAAHPQPTADSESVAWRLAHCRACPDLRYGSTCKYCGCLVEVRARLLRTACPRPGSPAW